MATQNKSLLTILALITVYIVWSFTYLFIKFAVADIPPMLMAGSRYVIAGIILYLFLKWRGVPTPSRKEWQGAAVVGIFLLLGGNGLLAWAEKWTTSSVAAINLAIIPVLTCLFSVFLGERRVFTEWLGVIIGFLGIVILNISQDLRAAFPGNILLGLAPISWSVGVIIGRHVTLPRGLMASAAQMIAGGLITTVCGLLLGERLTHTPSVLAVYSYLYLVIFGSIVGFSAFTYLAKNTSPALSTSNTFINPVLAVLAGVLFNRETLSPHLFISLCAVVLGVGFVALSKANKIKKKLK